MAEPRRCLASLAITVATLGPGITACGDDAGESDSAATHTTSSTAAPTATSSAPTTTSTSAPATSTSVATDPFCTDYLAVSQALSTAPWNGEPSTYPTRDVMAEYYADAVAPLVSRLAGDPAPQAVSTDVATYLEVLLRFGAGHADLSAIANPAYYESGAAIDVHAFENCGFSVNEVIGVDDSFSGLPTVLPVGANAFEFTNRSTSGEWHELQLLRKNDGVTRAFDEILALPANERSEEATLIGKNLAMPNESTYVFADLQSGSYIAMCSLPQGTTGHALGHGPPHFTLGMTHEFTVE